MARKRVALEISIDQSRALPLTLIYPSIVCSSQWHDASRLTAEKVIFVIQVLVHFLRFDGIRHLSRIDPYSGSSYARS